MSVAATIKPKRKNLHIGAKPGAGRPPGSLSARTKFIRAVSDNAIRAGVTPLEVMLDNMRWYYQKAGDLLQEILDARKKKQLSEDHIIALAKVYQYREHSQKCAADAAPFVHARLSAVSVTGEVTQRHTLPDGLELAKALELYRESLKGRAATQMKTIDHQPVSKDQAS